MFRAFRSMLRSPETRWIAVAALLTIGVGTIAYSILEGWSLLDSLYFCVVTLATIGFGDLHPTTSAAKVFTIIYIFAGLSIIAAFISELGRERRAAGPMWRQRQDDLAALGGRAGPPGQDEEGLPTAPATEPDRRGDQ